MTSRPREVPRGFVRVKRLWLRLCVSSTVRDERTLCSSREVASKRAVGRVSRSSDRCSAARAPPSSGSESSLLDKRSQYSLTRCPGTAPDPSGDAIGTWDTGHFDNDTAADFSHTLDEATEAERESILRCALLLAIDSQGYLDCDIAAGAIASAALVAAQCPGGELITTAYGPKRPLPQLSPDLRDLAIRALDRAVT